MTVEPFEVSFRRLTTGQIERYLHADQPYGCAGGFKSEALGIILFERFQGRDPNSPGGFAQLKTFCSSVSSPPAGFLVGVSTDKSPSFAKCSIVRFVLSYI